MRGFYLILALALLGTSTPGLYAFAEGNSTRCFLYGAIKSTAVSGSKSDSGIGDMIRLKMDADTVDRCEKMISSYCRYNVLDRQYLPKSLKAYFKVDGKNASETQFSIDEKCNIRRSDTSSD